MEVASEIVATITEPSLMVGPEVRVDDACKMYIHMHMLVRVPGESCLFYPASK